MTTPYAPPTTPPPAPPPPPPPVGQAAARAGRLVAGLVLVVAGVVWTLVAWSSPFDRSPDVATTTHPGVGRVVLDLRANGEVHVDTHDRDEIVVTERVVTRLREVDVTQRVIDGTELRIASSACGWRLFGFFDRCSASFELTVPASTVVVGSVRHGDVMLAGPMGAVDLRTGHGRTEAVGIAGDVRLRSGHGDAFARDVAGDVVLDTGHGSVDVTAVEGNVTLESGHGDVRVERIGGTLDVDTGHGLIEVVDVGGDTIAVRSGHGDVFLAPHSSPATIAVRTGHGGLHVLLPPDAPPYAVTTSGRDTSVTVATDPGAPHTLDARTGHGPVTIANDR